ncbi:MAG: hypothetical protein PHT31_04615 [Candidatus Omnitrophica bacterium]|nr:hypothetical protein [Candidatus Omnitrophota bacterium]MDD5653428.1 hypothetical protein [Candidatus Omnitrophota bacterium]
MEEKITPEERLLKIIENPATEKRRIITPAVKQKFSLKNIKGMISGFKLDKELLKRFDLRMATKVAAVACVCFTFFWIFDFIRSGIALNKRFEKLVAESASAQNVEKNLPVLNVDMNELSQQVRSRNIFSFVPTRAVAGEFTTEVPVAITNYKLVGIMWSDNPQAMIEDTKEQKTYLLGNGDQLGQVKVKKIFRDKVVIGKDEQEWELR